MYHGSDVSKALVLNMNAQTTNSLVTTAIGPKYIDDWMKFSRPLWESYARRHDIAIIVVTEDLLDKDSTYWKNGAWQKLLAPTLVSDHFPNIERICVLDTDIIMNPQAPNIFSFAHEDEFSVVSQEFDCPYPVDRIKRLVAFFRHNYYSESYPLDSLLFASPGEIMDLHNLPSVENYFCSGLFVVNTNKSPLMSDWFYSIKAQDAATSAAWEEPYLNNWIQRESHRWLPYEFQAIWNFEMAWKYPFLYGLGDSLAHNEIARDCVESSLWTNHFVHFAGSWFESQARYNTGLLLGDRPLGSNVEFQGYMNLPVTGQAKGKQLPVVDRDISS